MKFDIGTYSDIEKIFYQNKCKFIPTETIIRLIELNKISPELTYASYKENENKLREFINECPLLQIKRGRNGGVFLLFPRTDHTSFQKILNMQVDCFKVDMEENYEVIGDAWEEIGCINHANYNRLLAFEKRNGSLSLSQEEIKNLGYPLRNGYSPPLNREVKFDADPFCEAFLSKKNVPIEEAFPEEKDAEPGTMVQTLQLNIGKVQAWMKCKR